MSRMIRSIAVAVLALGFSSLAAAQGFNTRNLFFGGGIGSNSLDNAVGFNTGWNSATGYQFFGGYSFGQVAPQMNFDVEVGYMDSGTFTNSICGAFCDFNATGLWSTAVVRYSVAPTVELVGRAGLDFGDDDGFMFGVGAGYLLNRQMTLRGEYVVRQHINSLQFNFVYRP